MISVPLCLTCLNRILIQVFSRVLGYFSGLFPVYFDRESPKLTSSKKGKLLWL
jgi:hypothetical protein